MELIEGPRVRFSRGDSSPFKIIITHPSSLTDQPHNKNKNEQKTLKKSKVAAFRASAYKVTNGEFHAFVKAGGYNDRALWSDDGWRWRTFRNVKWPTFWVPGAFGLLLLL